MKKLTHMSVLAVLCLYLHAQQPTLNPLTKLDTIPDITITHVYNYHASTIHLSDLRGKPALLDFWAPNPRSPALTAGAGGILTFSWTDNSGPGHCQRH